MWGVNKKKAACKLHNIGANAKCHSRISNNNDYEILNIIVLEVKDMPHHKLLQGICNRR